LQWLTEHRAETAAAHDLSVGLRENYRARWKTAINAVRASTKFRTFAALASDERGEGEDADAHAAKETHASGVIPPSKSELYSDGSVSEPDDNAGYHTGEDEDKEKKKELDNMSEVAEQLKNSSM
jgi:calcium/calmodulin-dependent protein kinase I